MPAAAIAQAMSDRRLSIADRLVFWHLAKHSLDCVEFRPLRSGVLAKALRVEDQSVSRTLRALLELGYLEHERRARRLRAFRLAGGSPVPSNQLGVPPVPPSVENALEDTSLRPVQRLAMWHIAAGFLSVEEFRPLKSSALAAAIGVEDQTAARALRELSARGYLVSSPVVPSRHKAYRLPWTRRPLDRAA